ncbi:glycosyl hydrolase [Niabella ginsenosidivorans]|uniref:Glycosyl hydrolase n=1 Tax=Niabella ginsenosidivorans TaxID=1176587 RepID=A0A1A9HZE1_9BACT|nr:glycosyl hydrolase [Niabella ginsenosidivorans]ANH80777.1 glycosyl hydrolase [Niabella ginsenosidivorans]
MFRNVSLIMRWIFAGCLCLPANAQQTGPALNQLRTQFKNPPDSYKPGVYWYFMDGNLTADGVKKDLHAMKEAGISHVIFLEVNVGVPRGKIDFLSDQWLALFKVIEQEATLLGIDITLGIGPGWAGSGGPWVKPGQSMQHLVYSSVELDATAKGSVTLPVPAPVKPFFGEEALTPRLKQERDSFYRDVAVLAFPSPAENTSIDDIYNKALYYRAPFSSANNVKPYYAPEAIISSSSAKPGIPKASIIDLTKQLRKNGTLAWKPKTGKWTVMRFGVRNNGAVTRPAPLPGLGFEADKFDSTALQDHLDHYTGKILKTIEWKHQKKKGGLENLHIDSWEMGAQNWTENFRTAFIKKRGYDPLPFYPVYAGKIVVNNAISERFLWDLRKTAQELVLEQHAGFVKSYAHRNGLGLSIEPYDMNPAGDLELGSVADIPMCEFWSRGYGFNTQFSCIEATSIAHVQGKARVAAEAFTAQNNEAWKQYPGSLKNQGDWAFATGINRFFYHTFQSQILPDTLKPGMTMGPYGIHWDRNQTWWPMVRAYHQYVARCSYLLQQGNAVADILYLTPEEAPFVFEAPVSALSGDSLLRDRKGYNFDACPPTLIEKAVVKNGKICFPGGAAYELLVLPDYPAMSPRLLQKIMLLVKDGATVIGPPPVTAPGLSGYPVSETRVKKMTAALWGPLLQATDMATRKYGKGNIIWGSILKQQMDHLYCSYDILAGILKARGINENFGSDQPLRYTQRSLPGATIFFVSNTKDQAFTAECHFRASGKKAELWNPVNGTFRLINPVKQQQQISLSLSFAPWQSYFIIFTDAAAKEIPGTVATAIVQHRDTLKGSWNVSFDPKWGGPSQITFNQLSDWKLNSNEGIKYYSGTAVYRKTFDAPSMPGKNSNIYLDLGTVQQLASIKLNGHDLGVLWTAPWSVDISKWLRKKNNQLEISVANLWVNRLIGDQQFPDDGVINGNWPAWLLDQKPRTGKRYTFTTFNPYKKDDPLISSGLLGPVTLVWSK